MATVLRSSTLSPKTLTELQQQECYLLANKALGDRCFMRSLLNQRSVNVSYLHLLHKKFYNCTLKHLMLEQIICTQLLIHSSTAAEQTMALNVTNRSPVQ